MKIGHFFIILLYLTISSCSHRSGEERSPYHMNQAEELFFKNIRQTDYDLLENKEAGLRIYKHREFDTNDPMTLDIVQNWRESKAYLMLHWQGESELDTLLSVHASDSLQMVYTGESMENHREVAIFIANSLTNQATVFVRINGLNNKIEIPEVFYTVVKDYRKLTSPR